MGLNLLQIEVGYERDVVLARQRARQAAVLLGFESQDQIRIATAVSELARNAFRYANGGMVKFSLLDEQDPPLLEIIVSDRGGGIDQLDKVLGGSYVSQTGMGLGIIGVRKLMDYFDIQSGQGGTIVTIGKTLPRKAPVPDAKKSQEIAAALAAIAPDSPFAEVQRQNQELLRALEIVEKQRAELTELNRELEETNRGVVALYAELDQRADYLKRVSELKTQFLSNITHEFRTPLNSIRSISMMLLDRMDGELNTEQEKQVNYIRAGAETLSNLVNDLLDMAKIEAGKLTVRATSFNVADMLGMLRGMLKPLLGDNSRIALVFEEPEDIPLLLSDEEKVSQILRNFISNGLKYTTGGEVRVSVKMHGKNRVKFSVSDTGIGIAEKDQMRIFEEFIQVEGEHQAKTKGTGLGLPLSKKLAEIIGGFVEVESEPGIGSTFSLILPLKYNGPEEASLHREEEGFQPGFHRDGVHETALIIDDNETDRYVLKKLLHRFDVAIVEAGGGAEGLRLARELQPACIFLDLNMPEMSGLEVLKKLKSDTQLAGISVIVNTSKLLSYEEQDELEQLGGLVIAKSEILQNSTFLLLEKVLKPVNISAILQTPEN
ncbi:MAG: histidine kinase [Alphaproteobacteria bacterium]|nr:histidine kinase [Alphaproteobacteria bacterium]